MKKVLGIVMDPLTTLNVKKDTTLAFIEAAQRRNWRIMTMEQADLTLENNQPMARMTPTTVDLSTPDHWLSIEEPRHLPMNTLDVVLMRKDPPFDSEYIYSTYLLEAAERQGVLVVNKPQSLRDCNEKIFATWFPDCTPPLLVSRDIPSLKAFHQQQGDVVFKPLDGMGGTAVFRVKSDDPNLNVILETLTHHSTQTIMAQRYLPEITAGDKRILMVDGEAMPYCLARIPAAGELRGNLAAGGTGKVQPLTERDRHIASTVGPVLKEKSILFAGLDVIGDYLTEVNVTSPTCVREIEKVQPIGIADKLLDAIEQKLNH